MRSLFIYGASGHGLVAFDIAKVCGYDDIVFIDDGENEYTSFNEIKDENNIPIFIAIGDNRVRNKLYKKVKENGFEIITLVHPSAIVSTSAQIGIGTVIMPNVVVNAKAKIGKGTILNSGAVIEHEAILGDFVHISPNSAIAGGVNIGTLTHIGIGVSIIQGIKIGKNTLIGAGAVVVKNINDNKKAYGSPCREIEDLMNE